ncbi:MAG: HAMP domain-containing sensor histidine kinase, partial [Candidatus Parcubacteria bacterium]|nr:HAMP domain-containing sensor histidine kinase [Candidatus Parcubacteria bacterium]
DILGIWFALWILFSNKNAKVNRLFFLITISVLSWITLVYFASLSVHREQAIILSKLAYIPVYLFLLSVYYFTKFFPSEGKNIYNFDIFVLSSITIAAFITLFTDFHVKDVVFKEWGVSPVFGFGINFINAIIFIITILFSWLIFKKYYTLKNTEKLKTQYFLIGFFIFVILNLIFNVILASKYTDFPYYLIGNYSTIFLLGFTGYAIVKQELFGIKIIITSLFISLIAILLSLDAILFTSDKTLQFIKGVIIVIFVYFGYVLIKSTLKEIETRKEVERISKAKTEFISIASHQLRTPLTAIKGYLSMILEGTYGKLNQRMRKPVENIYNSNERLIKLVNDILNLSKIESGRAEMELNKGSLEVLISSIVNDLSITAKKKNIDLIWEKPKKPLPKILFDIEKMRQVIMNIIDNGIKYTNTGSVTVSIALKNIEYKGGKNILIEIKDTGEGLLEEEKGRLFESFSRGKVGQELWTEGSGVGLYVAKKFIEMHNGRIWAESKGRGKGTTFFIEIPVKPGEMAQFLKKF